MIDKPSAIWGGIVGIMILIIISFILGAGEMKGVRKANEKACRWYASQNHEKEFAPERYAKLKDLIDNFDWYTACMNNLENPVAK